MRSRAAFARDRAHRNGSPRMPAFERLTRLSAPHVFTLCMPCGVHRGDGSFLRTRASLRHLRGRTAHAAPSTPRREASAKGPQSRCAQGRLTRLRSRSVGKGNMHWWPAGRTVSQSPSGARGVGSGVAPWLRASPLALESAPAGALRAHTGARDGTDPGAEGVSVWGVRTCAFRPAADGKLAIERCTFILCHCRRLHRYHQRSSSTRCSSCHRTRCCCCCHCCPRRQTPTGHRIALISA